MGYVRLGKPGPAVQPALLDHRRPASARSPAGSARAPGRDAVRNPVALRVAFGGQHSGQPAQGALRRRRTNTTTRPWPSAREQAKEAKKAGDNYGAAALEFAVAYHKAALAWLKTAPTR